MSGPIRDPISLYKVRTGKFTKKAPWWEQNHRTLDTYINISYTNVI